MVKSINIHHLHIPVWNYDYNLIINDDENLVNDFLGEPAFDKYTNGSFIERDGTYFILWLRDLSDMSTLSHEVLHLVFHVMRSKGVELSTSSEESYTYLMGFVVDQILNDRGKGVKVKISPEEI